MADEYHTQLAESYFWSGYQMARNVFIGIFSVGLLIGACLFTHYIIRLSLLPKKSREYRQLSYHLESQTLIRYVVTICCLLLLNILFYSFFETGRHCTHIGIVVWAIFLSVRYLYQKVRKIPAK